MLKISRGVERDPEAERDAESYRDFDLKNRFYFGLLKKKWQLENAQDELRTPN